MPEELGWMVAVTSQECTQINSNLKEEWYSETRNW